MADHALSELAGTTLKSSVPGLSVAVLLVLVAAISIPSSAAAAKSCGTVTSDPVRVAKGSISCREAKSTARRFRHKRNCGTGMVGACVVSEFHCRAALAGEEESNHLAGYCYVLKHPLPAARDLSIFRLTSFKAAIAIGVPSSPRLHTLARRSSPRLDFFQTPSHNIACELDRRSGARCDIKDHSWPNPPKPGNCPVDWGDSLSVGHGQAHVTCHGDTTFGPNPVLPYGHSISVGAFSCTSTTSGVRCLNRRSGHGFFISRERKRLF
jgi:hypothetical protein